MQANGPTAVEFHTGLDDPLGHACRLLRKAWRQGTPVLVASAESTALSQRLWSLEAREFPAHAVAGASAAVFARSRLWLLDDFGSAPAGSRPAVWINAGAAAPASLEGCERLIELVGTDAASVEAGRERWRDYRQRGLAPAVAFDGRAPG